MTGRRYVVIGAGVVGAAVADELTARGAADVTVLDKGPLYATGGSSSHAPGLVSRTSPSRMMQALADYTVDKFTGLDLDGAPAMLPVGTLEVARNEPRLRELQRRWNATTAWGFRGRMVEPAEIADLWPIIDTAGLVGGYVTEGEGLAVALRAVEAQARRAIARGARFVGDTEVTGIEHRDGRVTGVRAGGEVIPADVVVCCAGVWGPTVASMVGLTLPMLALEHQYVITTPVAALAANVGNEATMPIVRHHDAGLYYRDHGDRVGIGSFNHRRLPVAATGLDTHERREDGIVYAFTPEDFAEPWELTCELMPALRETMLERSFNGVFAFTPDGYPLIGEHPDLRGFWVGESVWVTHSAGVGRVLAESIIDGAPSIDAAPRGPVAFRAPGTRPGGVRGAVRRLLPGRVRRAPSGGGPHERARPPLQPVRTTPARTGRGVLRHRGVGASAMVRGERPPGGCRHGPASRRVELALLVADRDRRAPRRAGARRRCST